MKHIVAVIRPSAVTDIEAVFDEEFPDLDMSVTRAEGYGRQKGHTEVYRGALYAIDFVPKLRIDIVCTNNDADRIVELVVAEVRTGTIGDGKVWVHPVDLMVTIDKLPRPGSIQGESTNLAP
ncbi:P-II family nitrogen regulator [Williamsia maris]|uniref:Nitrogen regulatory protein P-II family n=1 Tax=Williamsia maris TaxID=72806 RepID=A0ABT1HJB9_9NOCA|nr:P-II family nitrogen regulator [Williamsia maris]MCP2178030.1 nitrogen regulatory protein P-II family [Williamsia maris]